MDITTAGVVRRMFLSFLRGLFQVFEDGFSFLSEDDYGIIGFLYGRLGKFGISVKNTKEEALAEKNGRGFHSNKFG